MVTESAAAGDPILFTVTADPAPADDLTVSVKIGAAPCSFEQSQTVTLDAGQREAALTVNTGGIEVGSAECRITATIVEDAGYRAGTTGNTAQGAIAASPEGESHEGENPASEGPGDESPHREDPSEETTTVNTEPAITVQADVATVVEGNPVSFTLTAVPPPASTLTVDVTWSDPGSFLTGTPPATVTIDTSGTGTATADTDDDSLHESDDSVTLTVASVSGYRAGASGVVTVTDDDPPIVIRVEAADGLRANPDPTITAFPYGVMGVPWSFEISATPAPPSPLVVNLRWSASVDSVVAGFPTQVTIPTTGTTTLVVTPNVPSDGEIDLTRSVDRITTWLFAEPGPGYTLPDELFGYAELIYTDNLPDRWLVVESPGGVRWGDTDGPPTDGTLTEMHLRNISVGNNYLLRVDRGSSSSCTMTLDPWKNPGSGSLDQGEIRVKILDQAWSTLTAAQDVTFDEASDLVHIGAVNGSPIVLDVTVSC